MLKGILAKLKYCTCKVSYGGTWHPYDDALKDVGIPIDEASCTDTDVDSRSGYGSEDRLHDIKDTRVIRWKQSLQVRTYPINLRKNACVIKHDLGFCNSPHIVRAMSQNIIEKAAMIFQDHDGNWINSSRSSNAVRIIMKYCVIRSLTSLSFESYVLDIGWRKNSLTSVNQVLWHSWKRMEDDSPSVSTFLDQFRFRWWTHDNLMCSSFNNNWMALDFLFQKKLHGKKSGRG